ncbi:MAG TPA: PIN domain-containing protein [Polyangiaceae bacterium]|jgi:predicted nucleic acid-binding protein|nr:PIN domain-containing protein [Polyangiaceae bacterium]
MNGVTFDTGALIGLERRSERMKAVIARIADRQLPVTVPSVVVAEWYREQRDARRILALAKSVEPTTEALAQLAGVALKLTGGNNTIDAIVMASAAQRGDVVYTSDMDDLLAFADVFPGVRVLGVGG